MKQPDKKVWLNNIVLEPRDAELYVMPFPESNGKYRIVVLGGSPFLVNYFLEFYGNGFDQIDEIKPIISFSAGTLYHWAGQVIIEDGKMMASNGTWTSSVLFSSKKIVPEKIPVPKKKRGQTK